MEDLTPNLIQHMELVFGEIQGGFTVPSELPTTPGVQYVEYKNGSVRNVTVISTLGLSRFELASSTSDKKIRQELFLMVKDGQPSGTTPAVLHQIVNERLHSNRAILRGEALRKTGCPFPQKDFVALYATLPIYYPTEMWTCQTDEGDVALCWMFPIRDKEWRYLSEKGWSEFESLLDQAQFDLFDLDRPSLV